MAGISAAAGVTFAVMATLYIGIIYQSTVDQCLDSFVSRARYAAVKSDSSLCQRILCATADATANQYIDTEIFQKSSQSAVTAPSSIFNGRREDFAVFDLINFEVFSVTEVLIDLPVFVSD